MVQEFLSLKQKTETVTKIPWMFHERAFCCSEHVSTKQERVSQYLSILRRNICDFVVNTTYRILVELQTNARRREIELETQARYEKETQVRDKRPV